MSIKINDLVNTQAQKPGEGQAAGAKRGENASATGGSAPAKSDTVSFTNGAQLMKELDEMIAAAPAVDTRRVEEIRTAIAEGRYEIDPVRIAEKLMQLEERL